MFLCIIVATLEIFSWNIMSNAEIIKHYSKRTLPCGLNVILLTGVEFLNFPIRYLLLNLGHLTGTQLPLGDKFIG